MKRFKQYISDEPLLEAKNTHLTHAADLAFEGSGRIRESIAFLESLVDMLKGSSKSKVNLTRKWDGAPAVFCGTNPDNGKFFVGTKSIFNKTPKINYTNADIDRNHSGGLADKLKESLKHFKKLKIKGILQGDLLFGSGDMSTKDIDGQKYLTFTPNTITYAVLADSNLAKTLNKSKIGIVFHTKYTGKTMSELKASFNVSKSDFGSATGVWADDAGYKDASGKATFTVEEYKKAQKLLSRIKLLGKKASAASNSIAKNPEIFAQINIYANAKVRQGDYRFSSKEFTNFVNDKLEDKLKSLKSEKGRERRRLSNNKMVSTLKSKSKQLDLVFALNSAIQECVVFLVRKLQEVQSLRTFIKNSSGYRVSGDEGFVASDKVGTAIKLVDRLEFSRANFTVDKNWVKG